MREVKAQVVHFDPFAVIHEAEAKTPTASALNFAVGEVLGSYVVIFKILVLFCTSFS